MEYKDYYDILGVKRSAEKTEIKKAYRKLARKYHPDVSKEADAETQFKALSEAYNVLKDKEKREAYDQLGSNWKAGQDFHSPPGWEAHASAGRGGQSYSQTAGRGAGGSADYSDFFESLFGQTGGMGGGMGGGTYEGFGQVNDTQQDQHARVQIDLADAYHGTTRELSLSEPAHDAGGQVVNKARTLKIKIPKGIAQGQTMRLKGQGAAGLGGAKRGDLFLEINFKPHALFGVEGKNIQLSLPVAPWELALGGKLEVPMPDGKKLSFNLPAGSEAGKRFRLKGKGIPAKIPGDLLLSIKLVTPAANSDEIKAAYEALKKASNFDARENLK